MAPLNPLATNPVFRIPTAFVLLCGLALFATGCGKGGGEGGSARRADADVKPLEITESMALLERAKARPGIQMQVQICEQILTEYPDSPEVEEALYFLAKSLAFLNRYEDAVTRYRELVERFPGGSFNVDAHQYIWNYARKAEKDEEAFQKAVQTAITDTKLYLSSNPEGWLSAQGTSLAYAYLELEDYDGARDTYERIVQSEPTDDPLREQARITAQFHIGNIYREQDARDEAIAAYEKALELVKASDEVLAPETRDTNEASIRQAIGELRGG